MNTNYLSLSYPEKVARIDALQLMRIDVLKNSVKAKRAKPGKERKKKMVFFNDEIEKMFKSMPQESQDFITRGGK